MKAVPEVAEGEPGAPLAQFHCRCRRIAEAWCRHQRPIEEQEDVVDAGARPVISVPFLMSIRVYVMSCISCASFV